MGALRDKILQVEDLPTEEVKTDEWAPYGVPFVVVRGLTSAEREQWEQWVGDVGKKQTFIREKLVAMTVMEDVGGTLQPAFSRQDVKMLSDRSSAVIIRIWDVARKLSGMQTEAELEAQANPSKGDQDESDSSDSP